MRVVVAAFVIGCSVAVPVVAAMAQMLEGPEMAAALRRGGHVLVMRHASSPGQPPAPTAANPDNVTGERQLDAAGRAAASRMGEALRRLAIPVGEVVTSPAYRARETARYAGLENAKTEEALGDGGQSMKRADEKQATWLARKVGESPRAANTILITHQPNIARAFPDAADVAEGEALVFQPDGKGRARLVARVPIDRWPDVK
jgi:phosphohistidine phosphatase SixA